MRREFNILMSISVFLCFLLVAAIITVNLKESNSFKETPDNFKAVEPINYNNTFDVSDFTGTELNTIDIASKQYINNVINVVDSNFRISDELTNKIMNSINSFGTATAFYIVSLDDGMTVAYNVDKQFETASSIKAPYALWIYKQIAAGAISADQIIPYESYYYNPGTGVVKNSAPGTPYTVRDLVYYSLHESDNVAHIMLHKTFGVKGYNDMLGTLGTKQLYLTAGNPWGMTSCRSAALIWQDIFNFSLQSNEGITFLNILSNGKYNYYKEVMPTIASASKTGFANHDVLTTGIVFDKHPYIAIAIANKGGNRGAYTQVLQFINFMNEIMIEYDNYLKAQ